MHFPSLCYMGTQGFNMVGSKRCDIDSGKLEKEDQLC